MNGGIYIWGTGCTAGELIEKLPGSLDIRGFADSFPTADAFMGKPVVSPEALAALSPELIIVASRHTDEILRRCSELGIERSRLLFVKDSFRLADLNSGCDSALRLLGPELLRSLIPACRIVRESAYGGSALDGRDLENDYVRVRTLELTCEMLTDVPGAAAELGVYRGGFARCINALLPGRRLYLFDTFDGFDSAEAQHERQLGRCSEGFIEAHRDSSLERVLALMPYPGQVTPMPGLFPASLNGLEERFALVSLDADLEASTYAGLDYFVPRMNRGGFIFLHDYSSPLAGVRAAAERYQREHGLRFHALPLCDVNGTLVLCM